MQNIKRYGSRGIMKQNEKNGVEYLTFPSLEETGQVDHLFSTRLGGVSRGIFSSMNLSFTRGDNQEAVLENYRRIAEILHSSIENMVCSDQTHTTNIRLVTKEDRGKGVIRDKDYQDIDGLITKDGEVMLVTFFADCVPLFFLDKSNKAIGLAHSGWKGTVNKIGAAVMEAMNREFGTRPEDLLVAIGPSICQNCYEVSEDVAEQFLQAFPLEEERKKILMASREQGKYQLNLQQANVCIFRDCGLREEQIAVTDICTCCNPQYLFSHRASHGKRGNLAAFMGLRKN